MSSPANQPSPWPHRMALALVGATFPLIWVGGLVTTYRAGMAVPDWPTTYGYNLFLYPWQTWVFGPWDLFIEHGHRLLGASVGVIAIALLAVVWRRDPRRWMRYVAVAALAAVIFQGILGGLRVRLDQTLLARIHGCVAPAFFALAVAIEVMTSRWWRQASADSPSLAHVSRLAVATTLLAYLQIVLGSLLRHLPVGASSEQFRLALLFHLLVAGAVLLHVVLLAIRIGRDHAARRELIWPSRRLAVLVLVQLGLGGGTWVFKYGVPWLPFEWGAGFVVPAESFIQAMITTAHVAVGSVILATALVVALRALRLSAAAAGVSRPVPRAEVFA